MYSKNVVKLVYYLSKVKFYKTPFYNIDHIKFGLYFIEI